MVGELLVKAALAVIAVLGFFDGGISQKELDKYTHPAKITHNETSVEQQESKLIFGNLIIELPEGITVEVVDLDEAGAGQILRLSGAEKVLGTDKGYYKPDKPFSPQISMAHYTAEYERRESLISALLDLAPGTQLSCMYVDGQNREYVFYMQSGDGYENNYYALVNDKDVYIIMEYYWEEDYSFSALRAQERVKWQDSGKTIPDGKNSRELYFKISPEEGTAFLFHYLDGSLDLRLDGYYDSESNTSYGINYYKNYDDSKDINFDGYNDVEIFYASYLLIWNHEEKNFVKFKYPDDMPYSENRTSIPETKTIWCYEYEYPADYDSANKDYVESLWGWDGFKLVKRRECRAEIREDKVRIWAYEDNSNNVMFDESFTLEEWEDNSSVGIRELYGQFYDGLAPKEFLPAKAKGSEDKIPQGLLDKLASAMISGTELETLKAMLVSTELTQEEINVLAQENDDIREEVLECYNYGNSIMTMAAADVDNDGIEDIIAQLYGGGSGGYVYFVLFKGQEDGTYIRTSSFVSVMEEFGIVAYNGKNYLVRTRYDYTSKIYNGFSVIVYEDGVYAEEAELMLYAKDYDLKLDCNIQKYKNYAKGVMENALLYDERVGNYEIIVGDAEEIAEDNEDYEYMCDLDNDGEFEYYDKNIWTTTNMSTIDSLSFYNDEDAGVDLIREAIYERYQRDDYYNAIMLWADDADGETVVNVMYLTGLEDFVIVGHVVSGSECREVYEITAAAVMGVEQTRE